jgi:hypothetical protein
VNHNDSAFGDGNPQDFFIGNADRAFLPKLGKRLLFCIVFVRGSIKFIRPQVNNGTPVAAPR